MFELKLEPSLKCRLLHCWNKWQFVKHGGTDYCQCKKCRTTWVDYHAARK